LIGKASEIKTLLVNEVVGTSFDDSLNKALSLIRDSIVIDIRFTSTPDNDGVAYFNALIIFKEAGSNQQPIGD
jgi:hypothetical protein